MTLLTAIDNAFLNSSKAFVVTVFGYLGNTKMDAFFPK